MLSDNELEIIIGNLIKQKKELEETKKIRAELLLKVKSLESKINWNERRLIEYLEENDFDRFYLEDYKLIPKTKPFPEIKILKKVSEIPAEYLLTPKVNKKAILKTYYRKEYDKLQNWVEIDPDTSYLFIAPFKHGIKPKTQNKRIKELSIKGSQ